MAGNFASPAYVLPSQAIEQDTTNLYLHYEACSCWTSCIALAPEIPCYLHSQKRQKTGIGHIRKLHVQQENLVIMILVQIKSVQ